MNQTVQKVSENAHIATYVGAGGAVTFWGLQVNEWCAVVSATVAVLGFVLQCYVAYKRTRR